MKRERREGGERSMTRVGDRVKVRIRGGVLSTVVRLHSHNLLTRPLTWMSSMRGILPLTVPRMDDLVSCSSLRLTTDISIISTASSLPSSATTS